MEKIKDWILAYSANHEELMWSAFFVLMTYLVARFLLYVTKRFLLRNKKESEIDYGRRQSIFLLVRYFVWVIAITLMLEAVGFKISVLLAGSAALLVGLGLGLQQLFLDIVSGILLLFEGTIEIDDVVEVDGMIGRVVAMKIRTSNIATRDDVEVIVPNHKLIQDSVINWTHNTELTRFQITVGVAYGSDVELVTKILKDVCKGHSSVSTKSKPIVNLSDFGDSALIFDLYFWSDHAFLIEQVKSDLRMEINKIFIENDIQIPFPQRVIHTVKE